MITPAFSPTATERVLPRLALDFTTGVLDPRVTVARALNTATVTNSNGLIAGVNANLPRFDYDPVTLAPRGLLIEEARTNLSLHSETLSSTNWTRLNVGVSTAAGTSPTGANTACKVTTTTTPATHATFSTVAATVAGASYTSSVFAKAGELNWIVFGDVNVGYTYFNLVDGSFGNIVASIVSRTAKQYPNGWWRIEVTTTAAPNSGVFIGVSATNGGIAAAGANNTDGIFVFGAQWEAGAFATSYIPTTTLAVLRNADQVSMTGTNFSDWYTPSVGTLLARGAGQVAFNNMLVSMNNGTVTDELILGGSSSRASAFATASSVTQIFSQPVSVTANVPYSVALAYATNSAIAAANATLGVLDGTFTAPTVNRLDIGYYRGANTYLNGPVERIFYYTPRLLAAETQAISK